MTDRELAAQDLRIAEAWHDVTCPEAQSCRSRHLHALSAPLITSGVLYSFLHELRHPLFPPRSPEFNLDDARSALIQANERRAFIGHGPDQARERILRELYPAALDEIERLLRAQQQVAHAQADLVEPGDYEAQEVR